VYNSDVSSRYALEIESSAAKALQRLQRGDQIRVSKAIIALAKDPRPAGSIKLTGADAYRVRVGNYRVVCTVDDAVRVVAITRIGHRKEIYR
jgi:mRNA interferase RelE/StbE